MKTNRREFFQMFGAGVEGLSLGSTQTLAGCTPSHEKEARRDEQILFIGDDIAVADTTYGKVRGYILRDIHYFRTV